MNKNPAEIGERIKAARKAAGLSQTELANRLSKTLRTVQKYESGEIEPSIAIINAMAMEISEKIGKIDEELNRLYDEFMKLSEESEG